MYRVCLPVCLMDVSDGALKPGTTGSYGASSYKLQAASSLTASCRCQVKLKLSSSCLFRHIQDSCVAKCYTPPPLRKELPSAQSASCTWEATQLSSGCLLLAARDCAALAVANGACPRGHWQRHGRGHGCQEATRDAVDAPQNGTCLSAAHGPGDTRATRAAGTGSPGQPPGARGVTRGGLSRTPSPGSSGSSGVTRAMSRREARAVLRGINRVMRGCAAVAVANGPQRQIAIFKEP